MNLIIKKNKRILILLLILLILTFSLLIWYSEERINNSVPERATFVMNIIKESGEYKQRTCIHKFLQ